nr:hybrid sensor histidine kinase/response regulator [Sphingomonas melonis]
MPAGLANLIIESASEFAIVTLDREGIITSWNSGARNIMGWTAEEAIGQHGKMIFTAEDQAAGSPEDEMSRASRDGRAVDERPHMRADGSRYWGSGLMMPLRDGSDGEHGFVKMVRDRTAEHDADRRFTTLTDTLPGLVFVTDTDGHNVQVNGFFQKYTGREDGELLGDRWLEVIHPEDRARAGEVWSRAVSEGDPYEATYRFRRDDGAYRAFSCRAVPERDHEGRILRWIGTCINVENQVQAQEALERLNLALEHKATESESDLNSAVAQLESEMAERRRTEQALNQAQKMEAIGQLTGGVAHDFNNLLTVITSSVSLLRRGGLSEDRQRRYLDAIAETAERAAKLTQQLLAFARRQPLKPEQFNAGQRLQSISTMLKTIVGAPIEVTTHVDPDLRTICADPNQFETAVVNMAVNARDAMPRGGQLVLTARNVDAVPAIRGHPPLRGRFVAISVQDTGQGMSAETVTHIFEPFFTTKDVGRGTGLGLSQVHGFAKQSDGDIGVVSEPDRGTTFTLYLPHCEELPEARSEAIPQPEPELNGAPGMVLLVEDNRLIGEFAAQLLSELGFETRWAENAKAALVCLSENPGMFDVVFSDIVMPGMNGIELASKLRDEQPGLPVVLTSGYSDVLARSGSSGFPILQKPYSAERLASALRQAMANPQTEKRSPNEPHPID